MALDHLSRDECNKTPISMKKQPKYKVCRRLGPGVFEKCQTEKFTLAQTRKQKNQKRGRRKSISDYGRQLLDKQRVRMTYGINERQFRKYVNQAIESKTRASELLYELLESRLDNVVYRLGLAPTRRAARQMVSHGHILVSGKRVKVPSYHVTADDVITIREGSQDSGLFNTLTEYLEEYKMPEWVQFDMKKRQGSLVSVPSVSNDQTVEHDFTSVIEFYSK